MARIRIDFDTLRQQATTINGINDSYQQLTVRFNTLTQTIGAGWKGEAAARFIEGMGQYLIEARKLIDVIKAFQEYAVYTADRFETTDRECANRIRNAF